MKELWRKISESFSKYRDWGILVLALLGVLYFMQQGRALGDEDPERLWQQMYAKVVRPAPQPTGPVPEAPSISEQADEIFRTIEFEDIDGISTNPIFTEASLYRNLKQRLETLKQEYVSANEEGNSALAIEKLRQYCQSDPKGRILTWNTDPSEILANLECEEVARNLATALDGARQTRIELAQLEQTDPGAGVAKLDETIANLDRVIERGELVSNCEVRLDEAVSMRASLQRSRDDLNNEAVRREYDDLIRRAMALTATSPVDEVADIYQLLNQFRRALPARDPDNAILSDDEQRRLDEVKDNLDNQKEVRAEEIRQQIEGLAADGGYATDRGVLTEILEQFDRLSKLGDEQASRDRRRYEGLLQKLEAEEKVAELNRLVKRLEEDLDQLELSVEEGRDPRAQSTRIQELVGQIDPLVKDASVRRVRDYREIVKKYRAATRRLRSLVPSLRSES